MSGDTPSLADAIKSLYYSIRCNDGVMPALEDFAAAEQRMGSESIARKDAEASLADEVQKHMATRERDEARSDRSTAAPLCQDPKAWREQGSALFSAIAQLVAELPGRSSPDDWPEAMLVTDSELIDTMQAKLGDWLDAAAVAWSAQIRWREQLLDYHRRDMGILRAAGAKDSCSHDAINEIVAQRDDLRARLAAWRDCFVTDEESDEDAIERLGLMSKEHACMSITLAAAEREKHAHAARVLLDLATFGYSSLRATWPPTVDEMVKREEAAAKAKGEVGNG